MNASESLQYSKAINCFRQHVISEANNPLFIHNAWFVKYHLEIVEKIALELCDRHISADKDLVLILVWLHDYGKIIDIENQYDSTISLGRGKLLSCGFPIDLVEKLIDFVIILDRKENLHAAPIEVKIVSSADGASHLIGPFYHIFWKEFNDWTIEMLIKENRRKMILDWDKKIVLEDVREKFFERYQFLLESLGDYPNDFLISSKIDSL